MYFQIEYIQKYTFTIGATEEIHFEQTSKHTNVLSNDEYDI